MTSMMKIVIKKGFAGVLFGLASTAFALDASEQRYVDMLTEGSMYSVKQASQDIFNSGEDNQVVLDTLAEVLLQKVPTASTGDIDTLSWAAKALGKSRNPRYRDTLSTVASSGNKKLAKYANNALDDLSDSAVPQYKRGGVSLKNSGSSASKSSDSASHSNASASGKVQPLSAVKKGMSMAEAYALVGEPTTSTGHITGKAWIPFNFKGADTARQYSLYKGKGRIIFTNRSHYDHTWQVYEVQVDANESGYP
jgi:hypothetical protein